MPLQLKRSMHQKRRINKEKKFEKITFLGSISNSDVWLIDSGASGHMIGSQNPLSRVLDKHASLQVELGDNTKYEVKGASSTTFQLDSSDSLHLGKVLLVPGLKKNLISISSLEHKGMRVAFVDGQVLMWTKDSSILYVWERWFLYKV